MSWPVCKLTLIAAIALHQDASPDPPRPMAPAAADYRLAWSDEFDDPRLDAARWRHADRGPLSRARYVEHAAFIRNGRLRIETTSLAKADGTAELQTGMISTRGLFESTYGYFEARIRLPRQPGHGFSWTLASAPSTTPDEAGGVEVDIIEYACEPLRDDLARHTLTWTSPTEGPRQLRGGGRIAGLGDDFHTFGLLWTREGWVFYVDGQETWRVAEPLSNRPHYLMLGLDVGAWAGEIERADLPDGVEIDYVRVFQKR